MIIAKEQIQKLMQDGEIVFSPEIDALQVQSHSVDLRMGFTFLVPKLWHLTKNGREALRLDYLNADRPKYFEVVELEQGQYFEILPHEHVLVSTLESIKIPHNLMAVLYPRSSVNRRGLSVDLSGIVDAGYEGQLVIPVRNNTDGQTIKLYPGERFCQLVFEEIKDAKTGPKKSKYHKKDIISGALEEETMEEGELIKKGDLKELRKRFPLA